MRLRNKVVTDGQLAKPTVFAAFGLARMNLALPALGVKATLRLLGAQEPSNFEVSRCYLGFKIRGARFTWLLWQESQTRSFAASARNRERM
jgi:hypothetical protein